MALLLHEDRANAPRVPAAPAAKPDTATTATTAEELPPVQVIGMWDQERESPWLYAGLYAAAMLAGLLGHHAIGWAVKLWGGA